MNTYFIINLDDTNLTEILNFTVEDINSLRKSTDQTKCVVKLPLNTDIPPILQNYQSYSHSQILQVMGSSEWTSPDLI